MVTIEKRRELKSVTIYPALDVISLCHVDFITEGGVRIHEANARVTYAVTDLDRFQREAPEVAAKYLGVLGWTPEKAAAASKARQERNRQLEVQVPQPPVPAGKDEIN